jgi:hypothetical protein
MASSTPALSEAPAENHEIVHCDRCNSGVHARELLAKSWTGQATPSCPNCGNPIASQLPDISAIEVDPETSGAGELRLCPNCGGTYHSLSVDQQTGEVRPVRFCFRCGYRVSPD